MKTLILIVAISSHTFTKGWGVPPFICKQFSEASEIVAYIPNDQLPVALEYTNTLPEDSSRRLLFEAALTFVAANQIDNPLLAKQISLSLCLGKKQQGKNKWENYGRHNGST